jgi:hypothetical protein
MGHPGISAGWFFGKAAPHAIHTRRQQAFRSVEVPRFRIGISASLDSCTSHSMSTQIP